MLMLNETTKTFAASVIFTFEVAPSQWRARGGGLQIGTRLGRAADLLAYLCRSRTAVREDAARRRGVEGGSGGLLRRDSCLPCTSFASEATSVRQ